MKHVWYSIWQMVWGFPQTLLGFFAFLIFNRYRHVYFHGVVVTVWPLPSSLSLGLFVFVTDKAPRCRNLSDTCEGMLRRMVVHEYGHTVQSAILGPLYLLVIGIPSAIWANSHALMRKRQREGISYYNGLYTERWANALGERVLGDPSMENAIID